jgi:hypothetical protein
MYAAVRLGWYIWKLIQVTKNQQETTRSISQELNIQDRVLDEELGNLNESNPVVFSESVQN